MLTGAQKAARHLFKTLGYKHMRTIRFLTMFFVIYLLLTLFLWQLSGLIIFFLAFTNWMVYMVITAVFSLLVYSIGKFLSTLNPKEFNNRALLTAITCSCCTVFGFYIWRHIAIQPTDNMSLYIFLSMIILTVSLFTGVLKNIRGINNNGSH